MIVYGEKMVEDEVISGKYCPFCNSEAVIAERGYFVCIDCLNEFDQPESWPVDVWGEDG